MNTDSVNLLGLPRAELEAFFESLGEKPFRARQVMSWIYGRGVSDFGQMTDLSRKLREHLSVVARISVPGIVTEQRSKDETRKWMLGMDGTQGIETVFMHPADLGGDNRVALGNEPPLLLPGLEVCLPRILIRPGFLRVGM